MSQHQQQLEAARTTHKHTCLLLPLCSLCRAHVAKTKVRMRLGVSSTCHAGTNKQHSIACECDTLLPPQPPAQTSNHQPAVVGKRLVVWLCETRITFSISTHTTNTPGNEAAEKWKREGRRKKKWNGRKQPPAAPMGAITATRHHSCTAVPAHMQSGAAREGEGRSEGEHQMCADYTLCMACTHHPNHTPSLSQPHADGM